MYDTWPSHSKARCTELWYECTQLDISLSLFVEEADVKGYTDDNTPYVCSENIDVNLEKLEEVGKVLSEWFLTDLRVDGFGGCRKIISLTGI